MFAAHFAAGLALKGRAARVPLWSLLLGAFFLDLLWILFSALRLDTTGVDDWSHSFVMSLGWASVFSLPFKQLGFAAMGAAWLAVFSHFVLDVLVQGAAFYPHAPARFQIAPSVTSSYRWIQVGLCVLLLAVYVRDTRRLAISSRRTIATCLMVLALNGRFLLGY